MLGIALAVQIVFTGFEGAQLEKVEHSGATQFRCHLRGDVDQEKKNRQANWYYFRVDGARGHEVTIDLVNLPGEYNYKPNQGAVTKDTVPVWSEDNIHWTHFSSTEYDAKEPKLRLRFTPKADRFWIAHVPPYTNEHLAKLLAEFKESAFLKIESAGKTEGGREIPLLTIVDGPVQGKPVVWLMFRQHGWETGSSWAGDGAIRFLLSDDPTAARIRKETAFRIYPMSDPDGVARGNVRFNKKGYDLNRNWDVDDQTLMPEIYFERKAILDWVDSGHRLDLFLSVHNTETSEYLEGPPDRQGRYKKLGERFFAQLKTQSSFAPTRGLSWAEETTTAGMQGRMTVAQGLYHYRHLPSFLMEQMISNNPRLGHLPTIEDRQDFGRGLVKACWLAAK